MKLAKIGLIKSFWKNMDRYCLKKAAETRRNHQASDLNRTLSSLAHGRRSIEMQPLARMLSEPTHTPHAKYSWHMVKQCLVSAAELPEYEQLAGEVSTMIAKIELVALSPHRSRLEERIQNLDSQPEVEAGSALFLELSMQQVAHSPEELDAVFLGNSSPERIVSAGVGIDHDRIRNSIDRAGKQGSGKQWTTDAVLYRHLD